MSDSNAWPEFVKWLGQAIVVGVGWWIVHRLSVARDRDKARREMVTKSADGLMDNLSPILETARTYHLSSRDAALELRLKKALQDVAMRVQGLSDVCDNEVVLARCRSAILTLKKSITFEHFEDEHFGALVEGNQQLEAVAESVLRAKRYLLNLKHIQFSDKTNIG